jgi:hypothetical protein
MLAAAKRYLKKIVKREIWHEKRHWEAVEQIRVGDQVLVSIPVRVKMQVPGGGLHEAVQTLHNKPHDRGWRVCESEADQLKLVEGGWGNKSRFWPIFLSD